LTEQRLPLAWLVFKKQTRWQWSEHRMTNSLGKIGLIWEDWSYLSWRDDTQR
jgi:hypothetical protein